MIEKESTNSSPVLLSGFRRVDVISRNWNGIEVSYCEKYPIQGQSWVDMHSDKTRVLIRLGQRGGICEPRLKESQSLSRTRYDAVFFNLIPARFPLWCFSDGVHFLRDLQITFDLETLVQVMGDRSDYAKLSEPLLMVYDTRVTQCARMLADACVDSFPQDTLYGKSITLALLTALLNASHKKPVRIRATGLAPWQVRIAKEYLDAHFTKDVSLESLAQLTGLSRSWFARGFKASTGVAPYTWALQLRIRMAQQLLTNSSEPIASIATAVGFADQSHFTKAFKRAVGVTPREWRVEHQRISF